MTDKNSTGQNITFALPTTSGATYGLSGLPISLPPNEFTTTAALLANLAEAFRLIAELEARLEALERKP